MLIDIPGILLDPEILQSASNFLHFLLRHLMQKRSYGIDGSWVCTVHSEEVVRKGCHQFTTLSKMFKEFGEPRQFFMLVTKAFDNTYPYLLHAPGQSISDPDADQPPAFCYQIVSDPTVGHGYVSWGELPCHTPSLSSMRERSIWR